MKNLFKKLFVSSLIITLAFQYHPQEAKAYTATGFNAYYISVGKADCILIQQGDLYGLIDTGNTTDLAVVENFLDRKWVTTLEFIIITHLDVDHCGNVTPLAIEYNAKSIVYRELSSTAQEKLTSGGYLSRYNEILGLSAAKNTNSYAGRSLKFGDATINFYSRQASFIDDNDPKFNNVGLSTRINLDSLIFQIVYKSNKFFFLGDAGTSANDYVSNNYSAAILKSDVLKISHHGMSANNTVGIITSVGASIAINSASPDFATQATTKKRLEAANENVKIYETWNIPSYMPADSNTYTGILVMSNGTKVTTYGVYNRGATSCNKTKFN